MTTPVLRIRSVGPAFAIVLAEIHSRAFADSGQKVWSASSLAETAATPTTIIHLADCLGGGSLHRKKHTENAPIGFIVGRHAADEAEILTLCVLPEAQRIGAGHALVQSLASLFSRRTGALHLEVAAHNVSAIAFYERLGFVEVGRRNGYYATTTEPVDVILMARPFS